MYVRSLIALALLLPAVSVPLLGPAAWAVLLALLVATGVAMSRSPARRA